MNHKEDIVEKRELGIYIHIPFCARKCDYCDFISFPYQLQSEKIEDYIKTMEEEIDSYDVTPFNVTTIYIGGGTPSIIPSQYIEEILLRIKQKLEKSENPTKWKQIEITIEVLLSLSSASDNNFSYLIVNSVSSKTTPTF